MRKTMRVPRHGSRFRGVCCAIAKIALLGLFSPAPAVAAGAVAPVAGEPSPGGSAIAGSYGYGKTETDLRVKVTGGFVRFRREWSNGEWTFAPAWRPVEPRLNGDPIADGFAGLPEGAIPDALVRGRYTYSYIEDSDPKRWELNSRPGVTLVATEAGYRWRNRAGEWIDYDESGRIIEYGGRNDVTVAVERDADGRIKRLIDDNGEEVITLDYDGTGRVVRAVDRAGREVTYEWSDGALKRVIDARGEQWEYAYNTIAGQLRMTAHTDPDGRTTELHYAEIGGATACVPTGSGSFSFSGDDVVWNGRCVQRSVPSRAYLRKKSDARGVIERYSFAYDGDNDRFVRAIDRGGVLLERVIDDRGRVIESRINGKTIRQWRYGQSHRVMTDANGNETRMELNRYDEPVRIIHPGGATETYRYNRYGRVTRHTDEKGVVTVHEYDSNGNRIRTVEARGTPAEHVLEYEYNDQGERISRRIVGDADTPSAETRATYDRYGNLATLTDPAGNTISYASYTVTGKPTEWTDRGGNVWKSTYDAAGNRLSLTDPLGNSDGWEYDGAGHPVAWTDRGGDTRTYAYDDAGMHVSTELRGGGSRRYTYNALRQTRSVTDADGVVWQYRYDEMGRRSAITRPNGLERRFSYGGDESVYGPLQVVTIESAGRSVQYDYDNRRRVTAITALGDDGSRESIRFSYDRAGHLESMVDGEGQSKSYSYDARGRAVRITDAAGHAINLTYDDRGNLLSVVNAADVRIRRFAYDARGLRTSAEWPDGARREFEYNERGLMTLRRDAEGRIRTRAYDKVGRPVRVVHYVSDTALGAGNAQREVQRVFDPMGRVTSYTGPNSEAEYEYDQRGNRTAARIDFGTAAAEYALGYTAAGRRKTFTYPGGGTFSYSRDSIGRIKAITQPSGKTLSIAYDEDSGRPESVVFPGGTRRGVEHDDVGRITRVWARDPAGHFVQDLRYSKDRSARVTRMDTLDGAYTYAYDQSGRIVSATRPDGTVASYTYDPAGNRLTSPDTDGAWSYSSADELLGYDDTAFTYNANGELVEKETPSGVTTFERGVRGRIRTVDMPSGESVDYAYDPQGRRITRTGDGTTFFVYAEDGLIAEMDADGAVQKRYVWNPLAPWGTDPMAVQADGRTGYFINDHLGTPQSIMGQSGDRLWDADYSVFGEAAVETDAVANPLRFAGQYEDPLTGLHQNWARSYSPATGRYLRSDPYGIRAGINGYVYAGNNPLAYFDPEGRFVISGGIAVAAVAVGVGGTFGGFSAAMEDGATGGDIARGVAKGAATTAAAVAFPAKPALCAIFGGAAALESYLECGWVDPWEVGKGCLLGVMPYPSGAMKPATSLAGRAGRIALDRTAGQGYGAGLDAITP